jgi:signal transduction histidine kinase
MAWFSLASLRSKLQLFAFLLVLVPGALLALLAFLSVREALERAEGRQLARVARDSLDELAEALADGRKDLRGWARQDVMRDVIIGDLDKRVSRFLRSLTAGGAPYRDLFCVDRAGRVVSASDPSLLDSPLGEQRAARVALGGRKYLAGPIASAAGGRTSVDIAVPIADPDRADAVIGALVGRYDWRRAMGLVDRIRRSLLAYGLAVDVLVLDRHGDVIGESWRDDVAADEAERLRPVAGALARRLPGRGRHGFLVADAAAVLVGYDRHEDDRLGWTAVVMEPAAEAFAPVQRMQGRLEAALAVVLLGGLGIATLWAARMSRPLRELTRATRAIARPGEVPQPVPVRSRDEIGALATAFNTMGTALARAQADLLTAAKFAFIGEIAAGIAHEVRTPLGIMRSSAQMLARTLPPDLSESTELATMIVGEVDRIDRVVAGLLELSRPREPQMEPTALAPVLGRALDFVDGQAREKSIVLCRELDATQGLARCDPEQMYQVALNLLVNALQVVPAGGHISVRTIPRRDGHVGFEVIDDGPGVPSELHDRIFAPFFSRREGGTGLGLALVQRMVQAHQGTVTVHSTVGQGTTFRVELPVWGGER